MMFLKMLSDLEKRVFKWVVDDRILNLDSGQIKKSFI